jgi:hypothetical protein
MGSETRVCPRSIGWVVVEEFAGMMYFFGLNYYIIVIDDWRKHSHTLVSPTPQPLFTNATRGEMSGRTMGETNTGKGDLLIPVRMHPNEEKILSYYEEVREFVKNVDEGLLNSFDKLFPSPSELDSYPFFAYVDDRYDLFKHYTESHQLSAQGASICTVLHQHTEGSICSCPRSGRGSGRGSSSDSEMPTVYFPSMEAPITKDPSPSTKVPNVSIERLSEGFEKPYIDPHRFVQKIARRLSNYMNDYKFDPEYVAPYTSLLTSSMMGKSRLMKELASRIPIVYICVRDERESGFPRATPGMLKWFKDGVCGELDVEKTEPDIQGDVNHIVATLRHSLFLLHLLDNLGDLIDDLNQPRPTRYPGLYGQVKLSTSSFEWMWDFFADHREPYVSVNVDNSGKQSKHAQKTISSEFGRHRHRQHRTGPEII